MPIKTAYIYGKNDRNSEIFGDFRKVFANMDKTTPLKFISTGYVFFEKMSKKHLLWYSSKRTPSKRTKRQEFGACDDVWHSSVKLSKDHD